MLNTVGPELPLTTKFKPPDYSNYSLADGIFFFAGSLFQNSFCVTVWCILMTTLLWRCVVLPHLTPWELQAWPGFEHAKELHMCSFSPGHDSLSELKTELHKKSRYQISYMHWSAGVRVAMVPMENSPWFRKILFMCNVFKYRYR